MSFMEHERSKIFTNWDYLGSHYHYYREGQDVFHMEISSSLEGVFVEQRGIDAVAVVEILSKPDSSLIYLKIHICEHR